VQNYKNLFILQTFFEKKITFWQKKALFYQKIPFLVCLYEKFSVTLHPQ